MLMEVGDLLHAYRQRRNISLSELAERIDISKAALSKIESGETKRPGFSQWKKIASALNIPHVDVITAYLDTTERPVTLQLLLKEALELNYPPVVQLVALKLLETPKMDTFLALDHLLQATNDAKDQGVTLTLYNVMIDYARKHGVPFYLGKGLYERYMLERDDFSRFEETYRRGKELLHYIDLLSPIERITFYYRMGTHAYILGYYGESIEFCGKGIREDGTDNKPKASALISIVNSYLSLGDLILAELYLKEYEDSEYADYRKIHLRALLHAKQGKHEDAMRLYELCLADAGKDSRVTIVSDLLEVYLESGNDALIKKLIDSEDQFLPSDVLAHPYRIKQAARYYKRKGVSQLAIGHIEEGFDSLLQSISYYRQLGASDKVIEGVGLFLKHHRLQQKVFSFEDMEIIEKFCHNEGIYK
ncbi:putative DNA-binding protein [Brevibacillus brevis NBRC 100599]|uniref:Putative DNA-binding protein n=1 Tax=Brevibacillus brevis (strain 47 / JCM 6285 / NBRC 100599) TaxID=358681 RepID=C0Z4Q9_BREBN|nr:helix-turn-helix transcriptional regulator [Brevibacillus brevis]BAH41786.1 putative DNA-binding protein [Brevibacillus brevis NBRC 100599]